MRRELAVVPVLAAAFALWTLRPQPRVPEAALMWVLSNGPPPAPLVGEPVQDDDPDTALWLAVFTGPGAPLFDAWRARLVEVGPTLERALSDAGLGAEWLALPMIESGLRIDAVSRSGAVGVWQLTPILAGDLGLRAVPDDRRDLELSSRAAAGWLARLVRHYGDDLALVAYNAGPGATDEVIARAGSRDLAAVKPYLRPEARHFVAKVRAAQRLLQDAGEPLEHGPKIAR